MALRTFDCQCGHSFPGFTGGITKDGNLCPSCGGYDAMPRFEPGGNFKMPYDYDRAPQAEIELALENKAYVEANADKFRSGELTLKHGKEPQWLRPNIAA